MKPKPEANNPKRESALPSATLLAGINKSETEAWDNMRVKEDALQRATEELREATREWARQYAIMRESVKQQMPNEKLTQDARP